MGTPAYSRNQRANSGKYYGPTRGLASPRNSRRGCICPDGNRYSRECCNGALQEQGIGQTQSASINKGAFSSGFSNGFNILN